MPQEDYIKRQMELFARGLARLLDLPGGAKEWPEKAEQNADEILRREGLPCIREMITIDESRYLETLFRIRTFSMTELELLGKFLHRLSEAHPDTTALRRRALILYKYADANDSTYSLERHFIIASLSRDPEV